MDKILSWGQSVYVHSMKYEFKVPRGIVLQFFFVKMRSDQALIISAIFITELQYTTGSSSLIKVLQICHKTYYNLFQIGPEIKYGTSANILLLDKGMMNFQRFPFKSMTINSIQQSIAHCVIWVLRSRSPQWLSSKTQMVHVTQKRSARQLQVKI